MVNDKPVCDQINEILFEGRMETILMLMIIENMFGLDINSHNRTMMYLDVPHGGNN